jgi:hypothetical protein
VVGLDERFIKNLCRAANVEGTHGELRTRLTDRLRRNNTDSLAEVDRRTTRQITAVATGTHTKAGFAGQHRADAEFLDVRFLDLLHVFFSDLAASRDDHFVGLRMQHVFSRGTAKNALSRARR